MADRSVHPTTPPRFRVSFTADRREHDAHAAFRTREDARAFCEALLENLDVSSAHVLEPCSSCGVHSAHLDGVGPDSRMCPSCTTEPLMPARTWNVEPFAYLFSAEACEQCGVFVNVPDEDLHTDDGFVLCHGCADEGMPASMWARLRQERTS